MVHFDMWSDRWRDCTSSRPWESPSPSTDKSAPHESCRILPKKCLCRSGGGKGEGWNPYIWPLKPLASCMFVFHWVMKSWLFRRSLAVQRSWRLCWKMGGTSNLLHLGSRLRSFGFMVTIFPVSRCRNTGCRMMFGCPSQTYPWRILTVLQQKW